MMKVYRVELLNPDTGNILLGRYIGGQDISEKFCHEEIIRIANKLNIDIDGLIVIIEGI